jgi:LEA14-like dessication related protein
MKKLFSIIIILALLLSIIVTGLIFAVVQIIQSPEITAQLEVLEVSSEDITLETTLHVINNNPFELSINHFTVQSFTANNTKIAHLRIPGGIIPPKSQKIYTSIDRVAFQGETFGYLNNEITGTVVVNFYNLVQKELPLKVLVIISIGELIDKIALPRITMEPRLLNVNEEGLFFAFPIDIFNPNPFDMVIKKISLSIVNENSRSIGYIDVNGGIVPSYEHFFVNASGNILFEALNAKKIFINLSGNAGLKIGGSNHTLAFSAEIDALVPSIDQVLEIDRSLALSLSLDFKLKLRGVQTNVGFKIENPTKIPLVAEDLICSIYRLEGTTTKLLGQKDMESCEIQPNGTVCLFTEILLPYLELFKIGRLSFFPDWILLRIDGYFAIRGVEQRLPISISGYFDFKVFKINPLPEEP